MARLCIKSKGFNNPLIELKLGVNRLGRSPANDFEIDDPTVSGEHCEIVLGEQEVRVHDCNSTNGTYVDGQPICNETVRAGQTLRLGEIELLVESTEVKIAIPHFEVARPAPPVVLSDGSLLCPRHPQSQVRYKCTHCHEVMCESCVHRLRRRGGKTLNLCPLCKTDIAGAAFPRHSPDPFHLSIKRLLGRKLYAGVLISFERGGTTEVLLSLADKQKAISSSSFSHPRAIRTGSCDPSMTPSPLKGLACRHRSAG